jgi:hypothetical protein
MIRFMTREGARGDGGPTPEEEMRERREFAEGTRSKLRGLESEISSSFSRSRDFSEVSMGSVEEAIGLLEALKNSIEADSLNAQIDENARADALEKLEGSERGRKILKLREEMRSSFGFTPRYTPKSQLGRHKYSFFGYSPSAVEDLPAFESGLLFEISVGHLGEYGDIDFDHGSGHTDIKVSLNESGDGIDISYDGDDIDEEFRAKIEEEMRAMASK